MSDLARRRAELFFSVVATKLSSADVKGKKRIHNARPLAEAAGDTFCFRIFGRYLAALGISSRWGRVASSTIAVVFCMFCGPRTPLVKAFPDNPSWFRQNTYLLCSLL